MKLSGMKRFIYFYLFFVCTTAYAEWIGPVQVLTGGWGSGPAEFYKEGHPPYMTLPILTDISSAGLVAISDDSNGRIKIYGADGVLVRNITPPVANPERFGMDPEFVNNNIFLPADKYYFYSTSGIVVGEQNTSGKTGYFREYNAKLYIEVSSPIKQWLVYSPDGALLNTFQEKPKELGHMSEYIFGFHGAKTYRTTISYPDKEWTIVSSIGSCFEDSYLRDNTGNLYCVSEKHIERFSACGKVVSEFTVPDDIVTQEDMGPGVEPYITNVESYGNIEMGDNGDIYTSKITPTNFSVVKWAWQDDPNDPIGGPDAPYDLAAAPVATNIKLTWQPSLQDPGCVTDYEIERATVAGGPYAPLATVKAGILEYTDTGLTAGATYYYRIRAISAIANSDYTTEAMATAGQ